MIWEKIGSNKGSLKLFPKKPVIKPNCETAADLKVYGMSDVRNIHHPPPKPGSSRLTVLPASLVENDRSKQLLR